MLRKAQAVASNQPRESERGFTLIEMMIAAIVLMVGLISVVAVAVYVSRLNSMSNTLSVLVSNAQDEADKMRNLIWSNATEDPKLTIGGSLDYSASDSNHREQITNTAVGNVNVSWKVANGPGTTGDLRTVT